MITTDNYNCLSMVFSTSIRYVLLLLAFQFVFQITHAFWLNQPKFGTQFSGRSVGCRNNKVFARFSSQKAISSAPKKLPTNKDEKAELIDMLLRLIQEDGLDHGEEDSGVNNQNKMLNSVLRISCTHSEPNFGMPWQRQKQESSTSSGFVISNRRIITNAHSVEYGSLIQVKKRESEKKFLANVVAGTN